MIYLDTRTAINIGMAQRLAQPEPLTFTEYRGLNDWLDECWPTNRDTLIWEGAHATPEQRRTLIRHLTDEHADTTARMVALSLTETNEEATALLPTLILGVMVLSPQNLPLMRLYGQGGQYGWEQFHRETTGLLREASRWTMETWTGDLP